MTHRLRILAILCLGVMGAVPPPARAGSCTPLLTDLSNYVANNSSEEKLPCLAPGPFS